MSDFQGQRDDLVILVFSVFIQYLIFGNTVFWLVFSLVNIFILISLRVYFKRKDVVTHDMVENFGVFKGLIVIYMLKKGVVKLNVFIDEDNFKEIAEIKEGSYLDKYIKKKRKKGVDDREIKSNIIKQFSRYNIDVKDFKKVIEKELE